MGQKQNAAVIALMLSVAYAFALFDRMGFGVMEAQIALKFHLSVEQAADLGALYFWAYLMFQIPVGLLADAMGSRRAAIVGSALTAIGCLETALAPNATAMGVGRVVAAAGGAFALVAMVRYASLHFAQRQGSAVGRGLLIGNIGALLAMGPLAMLASGYQTVWLILAGLNATLGVSVALFAPETAGAAKGRGVFAKAARELPLIFASPWTYVGAVMLAGLPGGYYAFCAQAASRSLAQYGLPSGQWGWALAASAVGFAAGNFFWGWISDRAPPRAAMLLAVCGALSCWSALVGLRDPGFVLTATVFAAMGFFCSPTALIYSLIGKKFSDSLRGGAVGAINCGIPLGAALGQHLSGRLEGSEMLLPMGVGAFVALAMVGVSFLLPEPGQKAVGRARIVEDGQGEAGQLAA